jgi:hypothetical protein
MSPLFLVKNLREGSSSEDFEARRILGWEWHKFAAKFGTIIALRH